MTPTAFRTLKALQLILWLPVLMFFPLVLAIDILVISPSLNLETSLAESCRGVFRCWRRCAGLEDRS